jgi:hypothetical protein
MNKAKLKTRIAELYAQKISLDEAADILNKEGFRTRRGFEFNFSNLSHTALRLGIRKHKKSKRQTKTKVIDRAKRVPKSDKLAMIELVMSLDADSDKKLKLIETLAVM